MPTKPLDGAAAMWCDRCRADAAAEISLETDRAACATCGNDLGPIRRPATDQARELLKKWSAGIDLESPVAPKSSATPSNSLGQNDPPWADSVRDPVRLHRDEYQESEPTRSSSDSPSANGPSTPSWQTSAANHVPDAADDPPIVAMPQRETNAPSASIRIDAAHSAPASPPHFDVHMAIASRNEKGGQGAQVFGQILAYAGVLALTIGTALVIWSYFGGKADYAPTGWLVATGGQMLLFLGVVTLVAGGLEQTNRDMRIRADSLAERFRRIEQLTEELTKQRHDTTSRTSHASEKTRLRA